jgi:hypothetical protein
MALSPVATAAISMAVALRSPPAARRAKMENGCAARRAPPAATERAACGLPTADWPASVRPQAASVATCGAVAVRTPPAPRHAKAGNGGVRAQSRPDAAEPAASVLRPARSRAVRSRRAPAPSTASTSRPASTSRMRGPLPTRLPALPYRRAVPPRRRALASRHRPIRARVFRSRRAPRMQPAT